MDNAGERKPSASVEPWELDLIEKVASRFRTSQKEDLEAELARKLADLKRGPLPRIADWKAYAAKFLYNKAANWVRDLRARQRRELSTDLGPDEIQPVIRSEEADIRRLESEFEISRVRRLLDTKSFAFLELVADSDGNLSRVARLLGQHRNTIRRRLQTIRALINCPIENVSARSDRPSEPAQHASLVVMPQEREMLVRMAQTSRLPVRGVFKARLILALAAGHSYAQIERDLRTSAPTISRWKRRFERQGLEGLRAKHSGRKPRTDFRLLLENWRRTRERSHRSEHPSCRDLAREFGISKSTVHRILAVKTLHPES